MMSKKLQSVHDVLALITYSIKSVMGFGGVFSSGNVYAIVIFSKETIGKNNAKLFLSLNPAIKQITLPSEIEGKIFTHGVHMPLSPEENSKEESEINVKSFNEKVVDDHKKYLIEKEMSAGIRDELEMVNVHMLELAKELKRSNKSLEEEVIKRKDVEIDLLKNNEILEQRVANRTKKLEEQNIKLVKESRERKKVFSGGEYLS